jgi:hypothetical protein
MEGWTAILYWVNFPDFWCCDFHYQHTLDCCLLCLSYGNCIVNALTLELKTYIWVEESWPFLDTEVCYKLFSSEDIVVKLTDACGLQWAERFEIGLCLSFRCHNLLSIISRLGPELKCQCTLKDTRDLNGHPLLRMLLADNFTWRSVFSVSRCAPTVVIFHLQRAKSASVVIYFGKNPMNVKCFFNVYW